MEIKTKKTFLGCLQHFHVHAGNGSDILCVIFFVDDDDDDDNDTGDCSDLSNLKKRSERARNGSCYFLFL